MTKLEELSVLLVNEINDFNKSIEKLEKLSERIEATKLKIDLADFRSMVEDHKRHMEEHKRILETFEYRFNSKIKEAKIYPTWAVIVFIVCLIICLLLGCYVVVKLM